MAVGEGRRAPRGRWPREAHLPRPFAQIDPGDLLRIRVLATDIDDTLTSGGEITLPVLGVLSELASRGVEVVPVTGRPAGLLMGLLTYLPGITRGLAENGGAAVGRRGARVIVEGVALDDLRARLARCARAVLRAVPSAEPTPDAFARLTDTAFDLASLATGAADEIARIARDHGLATMASSIHLHVGSPGVNKGTGLWRLLSEGPLPPAGPEVMTVGDSPTDASLFDPGRYPVSVGVANVGRYLGGMDHPPAYVTVEAEGRGFLEVARAFLVARGRRASPPGEGRHP